MYAAVHSGYTRAMITAPANDAALPVLSSEAPAFEVVAIAASMGGFAAVSAVLAALPAGFPAAILIAQHRSSRHQSHMVELLSRRTPLQIMEAAHGVRLRPGTVHVAPAGRHLLVAPDRTLALLDGPPVGFVRPAADLLFGSVAAWFRSRAIGVVLSGMQRDGAAGALAIKRAGGRVLVQEDATCEAPSMPAATLAAGCVDFALPPSAIGRALAALVMTPGAAGLFWVPDATSARLAERNVPPLLPRWERAPRQQ